MNEETLAALEQLLERGSVQYIEDCCQFCVGELSSLMKENDKHAPWCPVLHADEILRRLRAG